MQSEPTGTWKGDWIAQRAKSTSSGDRLNYWIRRTEIWRKRLTNCKLREKESTSSPSRIWLSLTR